jgi:HlyD family secretion protein
MTRPLIPRTHRTLVLTIAALTVGCSGRDAPPVDSGERVFPVSVWTVGAEPVETRRTWTGQLEPLQTIAVQAPRDGRIVEVAVLNGDRVRANDVLARMAGPDLDARQRVLAEQVAQLEEELQRWERLATQGAAGPAEVNEARLRLLSAREQLEQVAAGVDAYVIRAPASGRIQRSLARPAAFMSTGQVLMHIDDDGSWGVRLTVPAAEIAFLEDLDQLLARDARGRDLEVARAVASQDSHPGLVQVDLYLRQTGDPSRAAVVVEYRSAETVLIVPWTAVAGNEGGHWVAVATPGDPQRVERRDVVLGRAYEQGLEVLDGLRAGEQVIRYEPRSHPEGRAVRPEVGAR